MTRNLFVICVLFVSFLAPACASVDSAAKEDHQRYHQRVGDGHKDVVLVPSELGHDAFELTPDQYRFIRAESMRNGLLDFRKNLQDNEVVYIGGQRYTANEAALYMWSSAVQKRGVKDPTVAAQLFEEIHNKALKVDQKIIIQASFDSY